MLARRYDQLRHHLQQPRPTTISADVLIERLHPHTAPSAAGWRAPRTWQEVRPLLDRLDPLARLFCAAIAARAASPAWRTWADEHDPQRATALEDALALVARWLAGEDVAPQTVADAEVALSAASRNATARAYHLTDVEVARFLELPLQDTTYEVAFSTEGELVRFGSERQQIAEANRAIAAGRAAKSARALLNAVDTKRRIAPPNLPVPPPIAGCFAEAVVEAARARIDDHGREAWEARFYRCWWRECRSRLAIADVATAELLRH